MKRAISGFRKDRAGDWIAELACGHTRHMRHDPPMRDVPWVETAPGRKAHIGTLLICKDCEMQTTAAEIEEQKRQRIAVAVKAECLKAALEGYEYAKLKGLCHEGAWELAVDSIKALDVQAVLRKLPE